MHGHLPILDRLTFGLLINFELKLKIDQNVNFVHLFWSIGFQINFELKLTKNTNFGQLQFDPYIRPLFGGMKHIRTRPT